MKYFIVVSEMTYTVTSGTLNPSIPSLSSLVKYAVLCVINCLFSLLMLVVTAFRNAVHCAYVRECIH